MIRVLLVSAALAFAPHLSAQQATQYLTKTHWATPTVEHLIRTGVIDDPNPLTRPLLIGAVVAELDSARLEHVSEAVRSTVESIRRGLAQELSTFRVDMYAGVVAATDGRRDPLREAGDGYVAGEGGIRPTAAFGPVAVSTKVYVSQRLKHDPDYTGNKDKWVLHRYTDAYVSLQTKYAELFYGAVDRNWGPTGVPGVLVSSEPYSYDHFAVRLGTKGVWLETLYTDLDTYRDANGNRIARHWVTHRIALRPWPWLMASANQATLWSGGGRGIELRWLNPLKLSRSSDLDEPNAPDSLNSVYGADVWLKLPGSVVFQGTFMADDFGFALGSTAPARLAWTAVLDVPVAAASIRLGHTLVSNLTYRSSTGGVETIMRRGVGLGRNFSDYTVVYAQVSLLPAPSTVIVPELMLLRQGEGDFREPFPELPADDTPFIFEGVVENTLRIGLRAQATAFGHFDIGGHAGVHFVSNAGHVQGASETLFVGGIRATVRWGTAVRLSAAGLH